MPIINRGHIFGAILGFVIYYSSILIYRSVFPPIRLFLEHYDYNYKLMRDKDGLTSTKPLNTNIEPVNNGITSHQTKGIDANDNILKPLMPSSNRNNGIQTDYMSMNTDNNNNNKVVARLRPVAISASTATPTLPSSSSSMQSIHSSDSAKQCIDMRSTYHVAPGTSWGSLPVDMQRTWSQLSCDQVIEDASEPVEVIPEIAIPPPSSEPKPASLFSRSKTSKASSSNKAQNIGLLKIDEDHKDWCEETKDKYQVMPMKSWGKLPGNMIDIWKSRRCDMVFTINRMSKRPISSCLTADASNKKISYKSHPNMNQSLPMIAVMAATTTRKVKNPSVNNMALFMYLLPSLIRSLDCGFRYEYVLGYDSGDPFYDSKEGMDAVKSWFAENVEMPLRANMIFISLRPVKVNNSLKKPGPVFNEMARAAYRDGAMYFFRINDDTEMLNHWPALFTNTLQSLGYPYGVVGPVCRQGNQQILTHDLVHRVHMEIFEMNYYPPQLTDWWMDDWISFVYGSARTYKSMKSQVLHHTGAHGQRYEVDRSHEHLLGQLIDEGHVKIKTYMLKHHVPDHIIQTFDSSKFHSFVHQDVPESVYKMSS